jgi:hypothetical protein
LHLSPRHCSHLIFCLSWWMIMAGQMQIGSEYL